MTSILTRTPGEMRLTEEGHHRSGRILAVEPDSTCAAFLRDTLRGLAELEIVSRVEDAIESIRQRVPDVVVTSAFLPPADESALSSCLRERHDASHVQVIWAPHAGADAVATGDESSSNVLSFLTRHRVVPGRPATDPAKVREQVRDYLAQAVRYRQERAEVAALASTNPTGLVALTSSQAASLSRSTSVLPRPGEAERRRARRIRGEDVPWLWKVRFPWGDAGRVVDISTRGALVESPIKVTPGNTINLHLLGDAMNVLVSARTVRADVARIDGSGVKYHLATAFSRDIDLAGFGVPAAPRYNPRLLVDLLRRVLDENGEPRNDLALRARLESALRQMFQVRDIQLRETLLETDPDAESIYFTVSQRPCQPWILQVMFDAGARPSAEEFRSLRAAAGLAGVLLQFASHDERCPS
jgi:hypothetical protein